MRKVKARIHDRFDRDNSFERVISFNSFVELDEKFANFVADTGLNCLINVEFEPVDWDNVTPDEEIELKHIEDVENNRKY